MQFFFLLLFNVFLGAVLYLVISLKLERSATEFRERRFRKEMDEIIKEFNVTAERNISLLEGRIRLLRRLMEKTGDIRSLDVTLDEVEGCERIDGSGGNLTVSIVRENTASVRGESAPCGVPVSGENNAGTLIKKGLLILFEKFIDILPLRKGPGPNDCVFSETTVIPVAAEASEELLQAPGTISGRDRTIIEKDMTQMMPAETAKSEERRRTLTADEIEEIVAASDDRYKLVSILFDGGCAVEDISRYSGIPAGEVRLVLNLNRSRDVSGT